ncbi:cytochrome P450 [Colletotrichum karsti]|uniref:Cytochrome P450 n=1 Tax=Colletotrichum karsti TaxID=1095194 RepID=A0A9P6LH21_9PEZI|nr:cytochrome P450 [Colletotrichum karsti]KAF9873073.1 cytochrome P450 [Colletotrichum karsti]
MPSHITVLPASTQAGKETIRFLLNSGDKLVVRGIYRDPFKAPPEFTSHANFEAVKGDIAAGTGLDFEGSDAVLYVPPPVWDGTDLTEFSKRTANYVAAALKKASSVKRLVIQSALGAQHDPDKIGTLKLNNITDNILKDAAPEVVIVRPGYYFHVWSQALKTMQEDPPRFESPFSPADFKMPMLSTKDIGEYCAKTLLADRIDPSKRDVRLFGPRHYSPLDVKEALEQVTGKKGELVVIPKDGLAGYWSEQIPEAYVPEFVQFITAVLPGGVIAQDYGDGEGVVRSHQSENITMFLAEPTILLWAGVAFSAFAILLFLGLRNPLSHVPGPWYTRFTHYVLKYQTMTGRRIHYVHDLHTQYGPIVRVSPFQVAVADPEEFTTIHRIGSGFLKSQWYEDFAGGSGIGSGVFAMTDPKRHAARRKLFARALSTNNIRDNCQSVVREKVVMAIDRIKAETLNGSTDVLNWWLLMASDVIGQLSFGESFELLEAGKKSEYIETLQATAISATLSYELPLLYKISAYIPVKSIQNLLTAGQRVSDYGGKAVSNLMNHRDNKANVFATMLAECDANEKVDLTPQDIRIEANNFIFAGADTTASTLTYLVWAVLKNPALQARLEAELAAVDESALLDDAFLETLPILNAVVEETLRLYTGVPSSLPRVVPSKGVTLGGYFIPAGLEVETQAYTLHRNPEVWPNPLKFDETRWLDPAGLTPLQKSTFNPFGAGTRVCIGLHLAKMEIRMAAALLFRKCAGLRLSSTMTDDIMSLENFFIIQPIGHRCDVTLSE